MIMWVDTISEKYNFSPCGIALFETGVIVVNKMSFHLNSFV